MANINTNGFIIAAISIIVSIILVTGVLIPVIADNSGTERTVLYTNEGDWYYNEVTESTQVSISISQNTNEDSRPVFSISINNGTAKPTDMPAWTSANSMDFASLPLFTFKTNDGKYGVEGIATIGNESMDAEYLLSGGLMYYRFIEGQAPELYYCIDIDSVTSPTITMANGVMSYSSFNQTPTALNGTYLLSITDGTTGDFTLMSGPTVMDDTSFYMADFNGSAGIETEDANTFIVLDEAIGAGCYGQISDYNTASKLCIYNFGRNYGTITSSISTSDAESDDGLVLGTVTITADETAQPPLTHFIVPVEIAVGGDSAMSPTLKSMVSVIPLIVIVGLIVGTVGYFIRRQ